MLTMSSAARTHQGRVRTTNEDSLLATARIVAVADGLGGHAAGEVASSMAVERLAALAEEQHLHPDDLLAAIRDANRLIVEQTRRKPAQQGMGTTLTGLAVVEIDGGQQCAVFNVGDSRVYRFSEDVLAQVTVDHSEVEELRAAGTITAEDAAVHPRRNVVTRSLGSVPPPAPDLWLCPPREGERYLVCSDGLTNEVPDDEIAVMLRDEADPGAAADALLDRALAAGGRDNIAVVVVDVGGCA